jgi:hypothetical protein
MDAWSVNWSSNCRFGNGDQLVSDILRFGGACRVLAPDDLRLRVSRSARRLLAAHDPGRSTRLEIRGEKQGLDIAL